MKKILVGVVVVGLLLFQLLFGHNGVLKYKEMLTIQSRYEAQIQELDSKILAMERELELLKKDNNYLEFVIRRELGLQKPDEEQYILKQDETVSGQ